MLAHTPPSNWELATLCAFNQTNVAGQVAFLACMDGREGMAPTSSKYCAKKQNLDDDKLNACYTGSLGQSLLADAAKVFNGQFPGPASVPHTFVGAKDTHANYDDLKKAICAAGSTAPACSAGPSPGPAPGPSPGPSPGPTPGPAQPCCKSCTVAGQVKYYSIDKVHNMCGECCMKPSQYKIYKIFEPGLTLAQDNTPCADSK